jgi:hypothetical protein
MTVRLQERVRVMLVAHYGHLYHRWHPVSGSGCFYCGEAVAVLDHVPALRNASLYVDRKRNRTRRPFLLVGACAPCNSKLSDKAPDALRERVEWLVRKLEQAFEKMHPSWSAEELKEMSPTMRKAFAARDRERSYQHARVVYAQWRALQQDFPDE